VSSMVVARDERTLAEDVADLERAVAGRPFHEVYLARRSQPS
jgi:hypothetical protein